MKSIFGKETEYMHNRVKSLLPIGTVVSLNRGSKKMMIFGIVQTMENNAEGKDGQYDYVGVPYPEGNMGQDFQYLFNHEDIEKIYFRGFEDIERQEFIYKLSEYFKENPEA